MKLGKCLFSYCLIVVLVALLSPVKLISAPIASKGVLDLSSWSPKDQKLVGLDGEWEFYWNRLIDPDGFSSGSVSEKTGYIEAPGYWDDYLVDGKPLGGIGYATFRLKVINVPLNKSYALDLPLMHTAYKMWVNGNLVSENGVVATSREKETAQYLPSTPVIKETAETLEIVLQVSNFHHNNGGIWQGFKIGESRDIISTSQMKTAFDLFLLGAIFIMGLYHFALFALRRKEVTPFFFGLFCVVISFRISVHGCTIFSQVFPNVPWELLVKLDYFTLYFGLTFFLAFIRWLYLFEYSKKLFNAIVVISVAFVIFTVVVPATVFTAYLAYYQLVMVISCLYTCFALVKAIRAKREGAAVVLGGCLVLIVTFVNDVLYNHEIIHTADLVGVGLFIMIFSQSYVLSARFSKAFKLVEILSIDLDKKVKERTAAIKDLLDNTGQGFFSFSKDYRIQKYTSRATREFFNRSIENEDVVILLFPESNTEHRKLLDLVFDNSGNLDLVGDILPSEVSKDGRTYKIDYHWIEPSENLSGRIMIVMTDISKQRELERQLEVDEAKNRMIVKIATDKQGFIEFISEVNRCISSAEASLEKDVSEIDFNEVFRHLHTIKGGMASYFFKSVSEKAHEIENLLDRVRKDEIKPDVGLIGSIKQGIEEMRSLLEDDLAEIEDIVPKQMLEAHNQNYYTVSEVKLGSLQKELNDIVKDASLVESLLKKVRKQPIRNVLKKFAADADNMAQDLGKEVNIEVKGEETEIIHDQYKSLFSSLIHLIRNAVDHGIESPETRFSSGKPNQGQIVVQVEEEDDNLVISVSDDGGGIETPAVKRKALSQELVTEEEIEKMNDEEIIKLIFKPGFSTSETVTDLSGRGVGMDAVADEVAKLKGRIKVKSAVGKGSRFIITVPIV